MEEDSVHSDSIPGEIMYADAEHKTDCGRYIIIYSRRPVRCQRLLLEEKLSA